MNKTIFLLTPPFTQMNTPYPATAYLKGFLNTRNIPAVQADFGIEVILKIFSKQGLTDLFSHLDSIRPEYSANARRIVQLKDDYIRTIDPVVRFLQGKNSTLAHLIAKRDFLPEADRFAQLDNLEHSFGTMGIQDSAKHLATMYLEDLSDLIREAVDTYFGFSRYAERLGRSANSFDELYRNLMGPVTYTDRILYQLLEQRLMNLQPCLVAISIPFPGNLWSGLRCGQWVKKNLPGTKVVLGGGFPNTELRALTDPRVFEFTDFITLDDGEAPIENLFRFLSGTNSPDQLKRTFLLEGGQVRFINNNQIKDYKQAKVGTPDYSDLPLDHYISAIEVINPMHRLWSDGRWNKLTMAHGCYWGKCTFCDISLDYIKLYEPLAAGLLCDRVEQLLAQTGESGFHFVDEAAPPALMRAFAIEVIRRKLTISWWTNVRFEKSFSRDLCILLKSSGCIAISGGLEVASDRLLALIEKGITVAQVARVTKNFTEAGIMVHAYLMYGFPTQTAQETIDSLEMVRQLFKAGILQSAFWHLFTMTAHSPVGLHPENFGVTRMDSGTGSFANNDLVHQDPAGAAHELFGFGLKKSLYNYMHGIGLDEPLQKWFETGPAGMKLPKTSIAPDYIIHSLEEERLLKFQPSARMLWLGKQPGSSYFTQSKKGNSREMISLEFQGKMKTQTIQLPKKQGDWLMSMLEKLRPSVPRPVTLLEVQREYEAAGLEDFELFWDNKPISTLYKQGLLRL